MEDQGYVDSRSSRKILKIGQDLVDEEHQGNLASAPNPAFTFESRFKAESDSEEGAAGNSEEEAWVDEADDVVEEVVCPEARDQKLSLIMLKYRKWIRMTSISSTSLCPLTPPTLSLNLPRMTKPRNKGQV